MLSKQMSLARALMPRRAVSPRGHGLAACTLVILLAMAASGAVARTPHAAPVALEESQMDEITAGFWFSSGDKKLSFDREITGRFSALFGALGVRRALGARAGGAPVSAPAQSRSVSVSAPPMESGFEAATPKAPVATWSLPTSLPTRLTVSSSSSSSSSSSHSSAAGGDGETGRRLTQTPVWSLNVNRADGDGKAISEARASGPGAQVWTGVRTEINGIAGHGRTTKTVDNGVFVSRSISVSFSTAPRAVSPPNHCCQ